MHGSLQTKIKISHLYTRSIWWVVQKTHNHLIPILGGGSLALWGYPCCHCLDWCRLHKGLWFWRCVSLYRRAGGQMSTVLKVAITTHNEVRLSGPCGPDSRAKATRAVIGKPFFRTELQFFKFSMSDQCYQLPIGFNCRCKRLAPLSRLSGRK